MSATTTTPDLARAARWFHALSDETRLHLVWLLAGGERCVCDLQDELDAAQSRLSFHLKTLREAGVVVDRKEGRWNYYSLNPDALETMREFLGEAAKPREHAGGCQGACCGPVTLGGPRAR